MEKRRVPHYYDVEERMKDLSYNPNVDLYKDSKFHRRDKKSFTVNDREYKSKT